MKRLVDFLLSLVGLVISSPVLLPVIAIVWVYDWHWPFYVAPRVGRDGRLFRMVKLRSMRVNADRIGVDSTSARDPRITPVGHFIRRYKLDSVPYLIINGKYKADVTSAGGQSQLISLVTDLAAKEQQGTN